MAIVVSAVFTMGGKLESQPIEAFESVAGEWIGSGRIPSYNIAFSVILIHPRRRVTPGARARI